MAIEKYDEMKSLRVLTVIFEPEIKARQIPLFRGAVISKVGKEIDLFHNHSDDGVIYRYPLIQYKRINRHPAIVCINEGIDEIHRLFSNPDWRVKLGEDELELRVLSLKVDRINLNVWERFFKYKIFNWIALNEQNYKKFKMLESEEERVSMLERILVANILSFAKGVDWTVEREIRVNVLQLFNQKFTWFKRNPFLAFDLVFETNVFLPNYIGLGKAVSHGYGKIVKIGKN